MPEQRPATPGMDGGTREPRVVMEVGVCLEKAQAHLDAGELAAALNECDQALRAAPQWAEAHNLRGIVLDEMGRTGEAIAAYREALRLDPALGDAAANLAEAQAELRPRPRWKRIAAIALPILVGLVVIVTVVALQARRGPDWRLTLNEYIAQRTQLHGVLTVQRVVAARHPANFVLAMGMPVPGGPLWESVRPVFPPRAVQCVLLEISCATCGTASGEAWRQVVYLAYHSDSLYRVGWRVYEAGREPFTPELQADLQAIGCDLHLE
jgi:tetratricopeptide (TPR) repeat protein